MRISVARLHEKSFETYIYAPTNMVYITLGYILTGALRGLYAGVFVFLMAALVGGYTFNLMLLLVVFLNCIIFSSLGFIASVKIDTHYDLNRFATLVITPMSFLCGTLYSVGNLPIYYKWFIEMLPLTHTTRLIRRSMLGYGIDEFSLIVTIFYIVILSMISFTLLNETYDI
jgi:ABC-type polysaccharide/polyol phosphate export permease